MFVIIELLKANCLVCMLDLLDCDYYIVEFSEESVGSVKCRVIRVMRAVNF